MTVGHDDEHVRTSGGRGPQDRRGGHCGRRLKKITTAIHGRHIITPSTYRFSGLYQRTLGNREKSTSHVATSACHSIANAAKHKLVGLLAAKLAPDDIYVGELMVLGTIKGSAWDTGHGNLDASAVADKFWSMYQARTEIRAEIG
jgi:hypothetical protein